MSDTFNEPKKRKPKRMFSDEEKKRIVEEFLESGLSASKFAPKYDIVIDLTPNARLLLISRLDQNRLSFSFQIA